MTTESLVALLTLWVIKPLLIIVLILLGALLLRRTSAALQHFWLASGVVAVLLLLILSPLIPDIEWQILPAADGNNLHPFFVGWYSMVAAINNPKSLLLLASVYVFVASSTLSYFLLGLWQLRRQTRAATACSDAEMQCVLQELRAQLGIERHVSLVTSEAVLSPQMWGVWRPVITLPINAAHWSSERKLSVLIHELGHVARCDWAMTVLVKILCALFWFLPPVLWLAARLNHCAEMACDDFIYRLRDKHIAYAENLLAFAAPQTSATDTTPALPMAGRAPMFYRIQAILDQRRPHTPVAPEARQYWVLTLFMLLLPLAGLQLIPIRETFLANLLIVQNPEKLQKSSLSDNEMNRDQIVLIDSATLQQLKPQLRVNELPRMRAHEIDNVIVTAEHQVFIDNSEFVTQDIELDVPRPSIRVEGYMPLHTVIPVYPRGALLQAIEGEVTVRFTINADGGVVDAEILEAHPRRVFDKTVLAALRNWHYKPQMIDGRPIVLRGVIEKFTFQLEPPGAKQRRR